MQPDKAVPDRLPPPIFSGPATGVGSCRRYLNRARAQRVSPPLDSIVLKLYFDGPELSQEDEIRAFSQIARVPDLAEGWVSSIGGYEIPTSRDGWIWLAAKAGVEREFIKGEVTPKGVCAILNSKCAPAAEFPPANLADQPVGESQRPAFRKGRLEKDDAKARRANMMALLQQHPSLKDDSAELARQVGVSARTIRRWLDELERRFQDSQSRNRRED